MIGAIALRIRAHSIALTLYQTLCSCNSEAWRRAIDTIDPKVHTIDRDATRIWFAFFPLKLHLALEAARAEGPEREAAVAQTLRLMGRWRLLHGDLRDTIPMGRSVGAGNCGFSSLVCQARGGTALAKRGP